MTFRFAICLGLVFAVNTTAQVVFEKISKYNHIRVYDQRGVRFLSFSGSRETRMSLADPLQGHFEYTEYFHMPWLWHKDISRVLMIGLGGGSSQRSFLQYHPEVRIDTVELDPAVVQVAREYFKLPDSARHKIHEVDGRVFLRRASTNQFDLIVLDAYASSRYGSYIPYHLATKEFFEIAQSRLTENGTLAYNVIGTIQGWRADTLGALYRTLKAVFPQVYMFPSTESLNVVLVATKSPERSTRASIAQAARELPAEKRQLPTFQQRVLRFSELTPPAAARSRVLTDNRAPTDNLPASSGK
jgi:spermidine synthase